MFEDTNIDERDTLDKTVEQSNTSGWTRNYTADELSKELLWTDRYDTETRKEKPRTINLYTGPMGHPMYYHYGLHAAFTEHDKNVNPLGASVAVLDPEWSKKVKHAYRGYLRALVEAKQNHPDIVNKIIVSANTFKLSLDRVKTAITDSDAYSEYKDPRNFEDRNLYYMIPQDEKLHMRNYDAIRKIMHHARNQAHVSAGGIDNQKIGIIANELLEDIAEKSVRLVEEVIDEFVDFEHNNIKREDFLITTDIGPEKNPNKSQQSEKDNTEYHRPTVRALKKAGVDYIHAGTIALASEAYSIARACEAESIPFAISIIPHPRGYTPNQSPETELAFLISQLANNYKQFLYAGVNCKSPEQLSTTIRNVSEAFQREKDGLLRMDKIPSSPDYLIRADVDRFLSKAYANGSEHPTHELDQQDSPYKMSDSNYIKQMTRLVRDNPHVRTIGGCCGTDWLDYKTLFPEIIGNLESKSAKESGYYRVKLPKFRTAIKNIIKFLSS